jgi:hypothetical protein
MTDDKEFTMPGFFVERPGDEYGNVGYGWAIIEAESRDEHTLQVIAPEAIRCRWPTVSARLFLEIEHRGPAQLVDHQTLKGCWLVNCIHITATLQEAYQQRSAGAMAWLLQLVARFLSGPSLAAVTEARFLSGEAFPEDEAMRDIIQRELDAIPQAQGFVLNYPLAEGIRLVLLGSERSDLSISLRSRSVEMQQRFEQFQARQGYLPSSVDWMKTVNEQFLKTMDA